MVHGLPAEDQEDVCLTEHLRAAWHNCGVLKFKTNPRLHGIYYMEQMRRGGLEAGKAILRELIAEVES